MSDATPNDRTRFGDGFKALFGGAAFIVRTPSVWLSALVPAVLLCVLIVVFGFVSFRYLGPVLTRFLPTPTTWYSTFGVEVVRYLGSALSAIAGVFIALALTPPLCGPALERIVRAQERELGFPSGTSLGFFAELWCGVRAQAAGAAFAVPVLAVLALADLVFPPATIVTMPAKFLVTALALSWNLFDYPLTLRGIPMRQRFALVRRHPKATLGFGVAFALLFLLPCCAVILLPVGVAGATRTVVRVLRADRALFPDIPREHSAPVSSG